MLNKSWVFITAPSLEILEQINILDQNNCVEMLELDNMETTNRFISHAKSKDTAGFGHSIVQFLEGWYKRQLISISPFGTHGVSGSIENHLVKWEDQKLDLNISKEMVHLVFFLLRTGYDTLPKATST